MPAPRRTPFRAKAERFAPEYSAALAVLTHGSREMSTPRRTESELKAAVESTLKQGLPDAIWREVADEWKEPARLGAPRAFDDLLEEIRRFLRVQAAARERKTTPPRPVAAVPRLSPRERLRSEVVTAEFAALARTFNSVGEFRALYLTKTLETPADVSRFLRTEAYGLLCGDELKRRGMPTAGLSSYALAQKTNVHRLEDGTLLAVSTHYLECAWESDGAATVAVPVAILPSTNEVPWIEFNESVPGKDWRISFRYLRGSVLDALVAIARSLSWQFGWKEVSSLLFVLTDTAPPSPAIHTDMEQRIGAPATRKEIILHVQPWTSADVVRAVYQHARERMLQRRWHPTAERSLRLFAEVSALRRRTPGLSWPKIAAAVGKTRNWRVVRQAFLRTARQLFGNRFAMDAMRANWPLPIVDEDNEVG